jgi:predicted nucleic acid-binding protein
MFDTNVFGKILRMQVPHNLLTDKHEYFVTHIQNDELNAAPQEIRKRLLTVFQVIPQQSIPTETAIFDISRFDMAKLGDAELYTLILRELDIKKSLAHENNIKDALIGETAIKNKIVLVTNDKALLDSVKGHAGTVMTFDAFQKAITA